MGTKRVAALALSLITLLISSCSVGPGSKGEIDFRDIFESRRGDQMQIQRTVELNIDNDRDEEWLVLYRYDPTQRQDWENTPIQGIVYDAIACDPPIIHNWRLPFPDNDYLGEGETIRAYTADWLASNESGAATNELIIDGPGPANTLSIYRFRDQLQNPCARPDDSKQGFSLLGFFRSNGPITWDETTRTITTFQRTSFERSQLAIRSTYRPVDRAGVESFLGDNGRTKNPDEQSIDFLYSQPTSPLESPYPEKAVAAFYLSLGTDRDNERARSFLTEELASEFENRPWGLDFNPSQIKRTLIYSISYTPDREAELAHRDREVTVLVAAVDQNNQRLPARRITWRLVGIPIQGEPDCEWRLAEIKSVIVTDGLGMLMGGR